MIALLGGSTLGWVTSSEQCCAQAARDSPCSRTEPGELPGLRRGPQAELLRLHRGPQAELPAPCPRAALAVGLLRWLGCIVSMNLIHEFNSLLPLFAHSLPEVCTFCANF